MYIRITSVSIAVNGEASANSLGMKSGSAPWRLAPANSFETTEKSTRPTDVIFVNLFSLVLVVFVVGASVTVIGGGVRRGRVANNILAFIVFQPRAMVTLEGRTAMAAIPSTIGTPDVVVAARVSHSFNAANAVLGDPLSPRLPLIVPPFLGVLLPLVPLVLFVVPVLRGGEGG